MRTSKLSALALAVLFGALCAANASAQDLHQNDFTEGLQGNVVDAFEPVDRDPLGDPAFDGVPSVDWNDIRNGWSGVIEEEMVLDALKPGPDPGAATPEYAIIQHESGTGPYWSPSSFDADCPELCFNIDVYADPLIVPAVDGLPDWWWTNAVGPGYVTETGMTGDSQPGGTWLFSTTGGAPIATVPVGLWYEMEVCIMQGADGNLDATHTLYDATGTIPLGSVTVTSMFLNPANQLLTPSYSWFTFFTGNVDVIFVDDFTVECVPEPTTFAMLGMGVVGLVVVARRRRRA